MKNLKLFLRNLLPSGQMQKFAGAVILFMVALSQPGRLVAQAPAISYSAPLTYSVGIAIAPLLPVNQGGAVGTLGFSSTAATVTTGLNDATCLAKDRSGALYIGESSGRISVLAQGSKSATVIASGFSSVASIAVDASYNVYVADGAFVWKMTALGNIKSKLGNFSKPVGLALDAAGNIYVADASGSGLGGVFKMAATGTAQVKVDNRPATSIARDGKGNLFFTSGGAVFELPAAGTEKSLPGFLNAMGAATDPSGNVYAACGTGGPITFCMLPVSGGLQTMLKVTIPGLNAQAGLMVDANFSVYAASGNIMKMNATGGYFISPELPPGLALNPTNGMLSGMPSAISPATVYTIHAFNPKGSSKATLDISVLNNDAGLGQINASTGTLTPAFSADITSYTLNVSSLTASVTVNPVSQNPDAKMTVDGTPIISGATSGPIELTEGGTKMITVVVTAPDRVTTKAYTFTVNRSQSGVGLDAVKTGVDTLSQEVSVNTTSHPMPLANDDIKVHQGVSPNGDGIDDFLQIDNIGQYPDNNLMVMNRSGQLIYEARGYDNTTKVFDGHSNQNGRMQLPGTYFYRLDYTVNGIVKHKTGYLLLKY